MNRYSFLITALAGIFCLGSAGAYTNQLEFTLGHGYPRTSISAGNSADKIGDTGTVWSGDIMHMVTPGAYVGLGGGHFRSNDNDSASFVSNANSILTSKVSSIFLLGRVDIPSQSRLVPYVMTGIGWVDNRLHVAASPTSPWSDTGTLEQRTILDESHSTIGWEEGVGLDYLLTQAIVIGIDGRYQGSLARTFHFTQEGASVTGTTAVSTAVTLYTVNVVLGIRY